MTQLAVCVNGCDCGLVMFLWCVEEICQKQVTVPSFFLKMTLPLLHFVTTLLFIVELLVLILVSGFLLIWDFFRLYALVHL